MRTNVLLSTDELRENEHESYEIKFQSLDDKSKLSFLTNNTLYVDIPILLCDEEAIMRVLNNQKKIDTNILTKDGKELALPDYVYNLLNKEIETIMSQNII